VYSKVRIMRGRLMSMPRDNVLSTVLILLLFGLSVSSHASGSSGQNKEPEQIDASDPTRIYTFAGLGLKYTDYTNTESMAELRAVGNIGIGSNMILFEFGYGKHSGNRVSGSNNGLTNSRFRWFHLFDMNYDLEKGYRGWATQIDLQLAGNLKGADAQNLISLGVLPAFALTADWDIYLPVNVVGSWDKDFSSSRGAGFNISPLLAVKLDWWQGAFMQFWPGYTRFLSGDLTGKGSANLDLHIGGELTPTTIMLLSMQKNLDKNLKTLPRGAGTGLTNDWNVFLNVTTYF